ARAAASAKLPPEPMAQTPSSGSMTSPVPETISELSRSATTRSASKRRSRRSVRQSFESSTAARRRFPFTDCSFASKRSKSVGAGAGEAREDAVVVQTADLARIRLEHGLTDRDLPVTAEDHASAVAYRQNRGAVQIKHGGARGHRRPSDGAGRRGCTAASS